MMPFVMLENRRKMKRIGLVLTVLLWVLVGNAQTNYYVSLSGNDANSGLSEAQAWRTITFAASTSSPVMPGDIVHIKAGDYGNEHVDLLLSGTSAHPIVFEGYQTTPGDNPSLNYTFGDTLNPSVMPLLDGGNRATAGTAISLYGQQFVVLKNLQIKNYEIGVDLGDAQNSSCENIIAMQLGDFNDGYDGRGFVVSAGAAGTGSHNTLKDCVVTNACAEGISITGANNTLDNCQVFCNENNTVYASMDYYIVLAGNDNLVKNCSIERVGDLEHGGAGIGIKEYGENNTFDNCTAKNLKNGGFYVRWAAVKNNVFNHCTAIGTLNDVNGFLIRDGASSNEFNACVSDGCTSAIRFAVSGEDANYCGRNNTFNNCIVKNATWAIEFISWAIAGPADHNSFINCVFHHATYLFDSSRDNHDNQMMNCIVKDVTNLKDGTKPLNFQYTYSDFNNGFTMPSGTGNISSDPQFVDENSGDFHLQAGSACIDAGTSTGAPVLDFDGVARPQGNGYDMGAFEASAPLVVDYLSPLRAFPKGDKILLTWQTTYEKNNDYFELQRSTNGFDWRQIGRLSPQNKNNQKYRFYDTSFPVGDLYYRIKQVDFDGNSSYSTIASLFVENVELDIYPNPTNGTIHLPNRFTNKYFRVLSPIGQAMQHGMIQTNEINLSRLPSGVYMFQVIDGDVLYNRMLRVL